MQARKEADMPTFGMSSVARKFAALLELAQDPGADTDALLGRALAAARANLDVDTVEAWMATADRGVLDRRATDPPASSPAAPIPLPTALCPAHSSLVRLPVEPGRSTLDAPLWRDGQLTGVLHVAARPADRIWTEEEQTFLAALAQVAATGLERIERRRAERQLVELERMVADVQVIGGLGSWEWNTETNQLEWSDEQCRLHGLDATTRPENFDEFLQCVHPDDRQAVVDVCQELILTGTPFEIHYRIVRPDGEIRFLVGHGRIVEDEAGRPVRMVGTSRDVTEQRRAQAAVRSSEESYRTIFDRASDAIFVHDPNTGEILDANIRACEMHGCSREELLRDGVAGLSIGRAPFTAQRALDLIHAAAAGEPQRFEWLARRRSGDAIWVEVRLERVTILGEPRVLANVRDISERKQAEQAMQEVNAELERRVAERTAELAEANRALAAEIAEHRLAREQLHRRTDELEGLFRALPDVYLRLSPDSVIIDHRMGSDGHMYPTPDGFPPSLVGVSITQILPPELLPRVAAAVEEMERTNRLVCIEYALPVQGNSRDFEVRLAPLPDATRIAVIRDITERKQTELELAEAKEAAEHANRAKSEFLSRMSHELRTPMNSILGFAQVLARAGLPPGQEKSVQHILRAGRHLLGLINEVLDIARIEVGRHPLSLEPVRLAAVIHETFAMARPLAVQWGVTLRETDDAHCRDWFVRADRQRLAQVLLNLLSNAIKYNRPGGTVSLQCERRVIDSETGEMRIIVRVEDTGRGIPVERRDMLFTPFARLGAEQTEIEGTGLGLALSRRLAEAMGGQLDLERSSPAGSVFRLELEAEHSPLVPVDLPALAEAPAEDTPHAPATLLYIEDNPANLTLVETVLQARPRWRTLSAIQGRIGIELAREHRPDLILLDIHLPDIQGDEVIERLRSDPRTADIPVVIISADATPRTAERLMDRGAAAFLTKPLDIDAFLATVERLLPAPAGS